MLAMANFKPLKIMRRNAEPVSDILSRFVYSNGLADGLVRQAVFDAWDKVSGASRYSSARSFKGGTLYVTLSSSVVRSSLSFRVGELLGLINEELERNETLALLGIRGCVNKIYLR